MILYIFPRKIGKDTDYFLGEHASIMLKVSSVKGKWCFSHCNLPRTKQERGPSCHTVIFPSMTPNSGGWGFLTALSPWVLKHLDVFLWRLLQHLFTWLKDAYVLTVSGFAREEERKGIALALFLLFSSPSLLPPDLSTCKGRGWSKENVAVRREREQQVWGVC